MRLLFTIFFGVLGSILCSFFLCVHAEGIENKDWDLSQYELLLLDKINWARTNPVEAALAVGVDPNQLFLESSVWHSIVADGLPLLQSNENLRQTARQHTEDMFLNHYYGKLSPDGSTPQDRIESGGYNASVFSEMLGMITFQNFMSPEIAVQNLVEYLIKRDILLLDSGKNNIFNPSLVDVGVGMMAGVFPVGNAFYNAYVVTCDFASPPVARFGYLEAEFLFLDLLNQARIAPLQTFENYGVDMTQLTSPCSTLYYILLSGLPPVVYSTSLREIALKRNEDIFKQQIFDDDQLHTGHWETSEESASQCPGLVNESMIAFKTADNIVTEEAVQLIFKELFIRELNAEDSSELWILNPNVQEIGMTLGQGVPQTATTENYQYVLSMAFGQDYLSTLEKQSLALLNQSRVQSSAVPEAPDSTSTPPEWSLPMPPLIPGCQVFAVADEHAIDMIQKGYYDTYSYDGTKDSSERMAAKGYWVDESAETIGSIIRDVPFDPAEAGSEMFAEMLTSRTSSGYGVQNLFNPRMKTAGIRFLYTEPLEEDSLATETKSFFHNYYTLLLVADQALPIEPREANIVGLIFRDLNGDGFYNRGEEIGSTPVVIRDGDSVFHFFSDSAGNFVVPLAPGYYEIEVVYGDNYLSRSIELGADNIMVLFPF